MATTLGVLAELVGGRLEGDASVTVTEAEVLSAAGPSDITLADGPQHQESLAASRAAAAVVAEGVELGGKSGIVVDDVHQAFARIVAVLRPSRAAASRGVHPTAWVSPDAQLGSDVQIGAGAHVGEGVTVGIGATIHAGVQVMANCTIGAKTILFPGVVLYERTQLGERVTVHGNAVLGAHGFGYDSGPEGHTPGAQLGHVRVDDDVEIGAGTTIDRGTYGATVIGAGTKIDNLVQIGHNCRIGRHNLLCAQVGIAGSTTTGDFVVMAGQVGVRDHVHIGERSIISAMAGVSNDVPADATMLGAPATPIREQKLQMAALAKLPEMRREFRKLQRQFAELTDRVADGDEQPKNERAA